MAARNTLTSYQSTVVESAADTVKSYQSTIIHVSTKHIEVLSVNNNTCQHQTH